MEYIYPVKILNHYASHLKLIYYCKATILQVKKKKGIKVPILEETQGMFLSLGSWLEYREICQSLHTRAHTHTLEDGIWVSNPGLSDANVFPNSQDDTDPPECLLKIPTLTSTHAPSM